MIFDRIVDTVIAGSVGDSTILAFTHSGICEFIQAVMNSFVYPRIQALIYSSEHSFIHTLIHSGI
jgi:hypothetical protein